MLVAALGPSNLRSRALARVVHQLGEWWSCGVQRPQTPCVCRVAWEQLLCAVHPEGWYRSGGSAAGTRTWVTCRGHETSVRVLLLSGRFTGVSVTNTVGTARLRVCQRSTVRAVPAGSNCCSTPRIPSVGVISQQGTVQLEVLLLSSLLCYMCHCGLMSGRVGVQQCCDCVGVCWPVVVFTNSAHS